MYPKNISFGRTRTALTAPVTAQYPHYWTYNGAVQLNTVSSVLTHNTEDRCMGDTVTPEFRKSVANGNIILNNMVSDYVKASYRGYRFEWTGKTPSNVPLFYRGYSLPSPSTALRAFTSPVDLWNSLEEAQGYRGLRDAAVVKSWSNIDQSSMAALATLGEMPETLRWIGSILKRLVNLIRFFRNPARKASDLLKLSGKRVPLKDVPFDVWLEWRYAIRPLIFEMKQALDALKAIIKKGSRQTARGYTYDIGVTTSSQTVGNSGNIVQYTWDTKVRKRIEFRGGVLYDLSESLNDLTTILGLDQPLEAAWELVPFSFILDWFFNIGTCLSSWSQGMGLSPLGSWVTCIWVTEKSAYGHSYGNIWDTNVCTKFEQIQLPSYSEVRLLKQRWIDPSRAVLPSFKLKLDSQKILDLVAIGRQLLKAKR